jgi:hypothetical protein
MRRALLTAEENALIDEYLSKLPPDIAKATLARASHLESERLVRMLRKSLLPALRPTRRLEKIREQLTPEENAMLDERRRRMSPAEAKAAEERLSQLDPDYAVNYLRSEILKTMTPASRMADLRARLSPEERDELDRCLPVEEQTGVVMGLLVGLKPDDAVSFLRHRVLKASHIVPDRSTEVSMRAQYGALFWHYLRAKPTHFVRGLVHKLWLFVTLCGLPQFAFLGSASAAASTLLLVGVLLALAAFLSGRWGQERRYAVGLLFAAYFLELGILVLVFVEPRFLLLNLTLATILCVRFGCDMLSRLFRSAQ